MMAKKKPAASPPGVAVDETSKPEPATEAAIQETETITVRVKELSMTVPCLVGVEGYCQNRVDVRLTGTQASKLKGIMQGLEQRDAVLGDGRAVKTQMHAIQWMIENAR